MSTLPEILPVLKTKRLLLREFSLDDADDVQRLAGAYDVARMIGIPHPYADDLAEEWIGSHAQRRADGLGLVWAVVRQSDSKLIGCTSLSCKNEEQSAELGYWVGTPYWGKGYATEAATAVVACGFVVVGLHRIYARHDTINPASGRVMVKAGMQYEGTRRHLIYKEGEWRDFAYYSILEDELEPGKNM